MTSSAPGSRGFFRNRASTAIAARAVAHAQPLLDCAMSFVAVRASARPSPAWMPRTTQCGINRPR